MKQLALCLSLLLGGCAGVPFPEYAPLQVESSRLFLHGSLASYQSQLRVVERATFTLADEEIALTLYAVSEDGRNLRLAAVSDLGSTVFGVEWTPAGLEILHESPNFPADLLREIALDQVVALLPPALEQVSLVRLEGGRTALHYQAAGGEVLAAVGEGEGRLRLERGEGGDLRSTILLLGDGLTERIEVRSTGGRYSAQMVVSAWDPGS